ncbi:uncharacterized protein LOC119472675 [Cebus imitator]|uniref:uncharacterized protein LOC119472675 n=1 Tax=Cebus imitator TaxID=2715852 RepID=UPI001899E776|nr:uncharacterized protein LOC119472675 [Cebus imitator]
MHCYLPKPLSWASGDLRILTRVCFRGIAGNRSPLTAGVGVRVAPGPRSPGCETLPPPESPQPPLGDLPRPFTASPAVWPRARRVFRFRAAEQEPRRARALVSAAHAAFPVPFSALRCGYGAWTPDATLTGPCAALDCGFPFRPAAFTPRPAPPRNAKKRNSQTRSGRRLLLQKRNLTPRPRTSGTCLPRAQSHPSLHVALDLPDMPFPTDPLLALCYPSKGFFIQGEYKCFQELAMTSPQHTHTSTPLHLLLPSQEPRQQHILGLCEQDGLMLSERGTVPWERRVGSSSAGTHVNRDFTLGEAVAASNGRRFP